jgi:hypothetical protein
VLTCVLGLAVWFAILMTCAFRVDRKIRRLDIEAAEKAARRTQPEPTDDVADR